MPLKSFKPYTPSRRSMTVEDFSNLTKKAPEKSLLRPLTKSGGRNNTGQIMVRHIGGGHARRYRLIDFKRDNWGIPGRVTSLEYDPNRTSRIALIFFANGDKRYIIAPEGLKIGDKLMAGPESEIRIGNALPLYAIPEGTVILKQKLLGDEYGEVLLYTGMLKREKDFNPECGDWV